MTWAGCWRFVRRNIRLISAFIVIEAVYTFFVFLFQDKPKQCQNLKQKITICSYRMVVRWFGHPRSISL